MKVLIALTPAFNPNDGGVQRTSYKIGKFFTENGIEVSYFSMERDGHIEVAYGELFHSKLVGGVKNPVNL
jgi:hypothetical protein